MRISRATLNAILATQTPRRPRGAWNHYLCPACNDKSGHLGVNIQTGAVKCVRCGATGSLFSGGGVVRKSNPRRLSLLGEEVVQFDTPDDKVHDYMLARGVSLPPSPDTWGYGTGWSTGCPVFMARNRSGELAYVQKRTNNPNSRYEAVPNTVPTVDMVGVRGKIVVITEGPISALVVAQETGMDAKPLWGAQPRTSTLRSMLGYPVDRVVLMFDPDTPGIRGMARVYTFLMMNGVRTSCVRYSKEDILSGDDPADMPKDRLLTLLGGSLCYSPGHETSLRGAHEARAGVEAARRRAARGANRKTTGDSIC